MENVNVNVKINVGAKTILLEILVHVSVVVASI